MPDAVSVSAATVSLGQTVTAFTFFLPSISAVREAGPEDTRMRGNVRLGEFAATALAVGVAIMIQQLTGSFASVTVSVVTAGIVVGVYELAMNTERLFENG